MIASPSMNPGRLDRRVTLRYSSAARDAAGGVTESWSNSTTVWAWWQPQPGREIQQAGQKIAIAAGIMRVRYSAAITALWRVVFDGTEYEITAPPVEVGRREYLDLIVRALPEYASSGGGLTDEGGTSLTDEGGVAIGAEG